MTEYGITEDGRAALGWWTNHLWERARVFEKVAEAAHAAVEERVGE